MVTKAKECGLCPNPAPAVSIIHASFSGENKMTEIPVCKYHANLAHALLDPGVKGSKTQVARARKSTPARRGRPPKKATASRKSASATNVADVREWAWSAGYELGERGRIPADIIEDYQKAQKK